MTLIAEATLRGAPELHLALLFFVPRQLPCGPVTGLVRRFTVRCQLMDTAPHHGADYSTYPRHVAAATKHDYDELLGIVVEMPRPGSGAVDNWVWS